jgi:excisionase family DNA binding protein
MTIPGLVFEHRLANISPNFFVTSERNCLRVPVDHRHDFFAQKKQLRKRRQHSMTTPLLTVKETASFLKCSTRTLQRLLEVGEGPPMIHLGGGIRFREDDVMDWVASRLKSKKEAKAE